MYIHAFLCTGFTVLQLIQSYEITIKNRCSKMILTNNDDEDNHTYHTQDNHHL